MKGGKSYTWGGSGWEGAKGGRGEAGQGVGKVGIGNWTLVRVSSKLMRHDAVKGEQAVRPEDGAVANAGE